LPIHFEENRGQTDARVKFLARGGGATLFLTSDEAVLLLTSNDSQGPAEWRQRGSQPSREQWKRAALRMTLLGANREARVSGVGELPGRTNHFLGSEPGKWRRNVPTYARVHYEDIYPGIDLTCYGKQRQLEYDFVVSPGANPSGIVLGFDGMDRLEVDAIGDLVLHTAAGPIRQRKPVIYQEVGGTRQPIEGRYAHRGSQKIGFQVAAFDRTKPLIIDPVLVYRTYLGGESDDRGIGIAIDSTGSAYVSGYTLSADFPKTLGVVDTSFNGVRDAFVTKLDPSGSILAYSTYLGGSSEDSGVGIAVDADGSAYVVGNTLSADFPTIAGHDMTYNGTGDVFVTKLDPSGSLVYSTYLGGSLQDGVQLGMAVDAAGNAYLTGSTSSMDFPTTPGAFDSTFNGGDYAGFGDVFVTKLDPSGATLVYSTYFGGSAAPHIPPWGTRGGDGARGIAVDGAGSAYITGLTSSADLPTTPGAYDSTFNGGLQDSFVAKLDPSGSELVYSTYLGGSFEDDGIGIAVDGAGSAYVAGRTFGSYDFPTTPGAFDITYSGGVSDATLTKLDPTGAVAYSSYLGGGGLDEGFGIEVDGAGRAYLSGFTNSAGFPTTPGALDTMPNGGVDVFITQMNAAGTAPVQSTFLGGAGDDFGYDLAIDGSGSVYVTGDTNSADFPATAGAFATTRAGGFDAFVAKISFAVPLIITADDKSMLLNGPLPTLTATYTGLVNGDSPADIDTPVSLSTTATGTSVGSFAIVASGAADPNYLITHENGVLTVSYAGGGTCLGASGHQILEPINVDGTSVFKRGSTVPVKFRACDANGASVGTPGLVAAFSLIQRIAGTIVSDVNEPVDSTTPDTVFRWSPSDQLWIFNLATKGLATNQTYVYRISLNDGSTIGFRFALK
jgi:hypothetical protein